MCYFYSQETPLGAWAFYLHIYFRCTQRMHAETPCLASAPDVKGYFLLLLSSSSWTYKTMALKSKEPGCHYFAILFNQGNMKSLLT